MAAVSARGRAPRVAAAGLAALLAAAPATLSQGAPPPGTAREVAARPGETLEVDLDAGGSIAVEAWDRDLVRVEPAGGAAPDAWSVGRIRDGVELRDAPSVRPGARRWTVRVPERFDLRLTTGGGTVRVSGVEGDVWIETLGGNVELSGVRGRVEASTQGGNVSAADSVLAGRLRTLGGNITLTRVEGPVESTTLAGNVTFDAVEASGGGGGGDANPLRIATHGGNIVVSRAPDGVDAETLGGNIEVGSVDRFARLKTNGGNIRIGSAAGRVAAKSLAGSVTAALAAGAAGTGGTEVRLSSLSGDVELTVPRGAGLDVEIELVYTKNSRRRYEIHSDFPLERRETAEWDYDHGTPRKTIRASGRVGGGGIAVRLETVNGDVRLIEAR